MLKLFKYFTKKDWLFISLSIILVVGQVWLDLRLPDYMSDITVLIKTPGSAMSDILIAGAKMLACALGSGALSVLVGFFAARVGANFGFHVGEAVFGKVSDFGVTEMQKFSTASLITRTTNDITQVQMVVSLGLQVLVKAPILAVWAVLKIVGKSVELSWVTAGAVVFLLSVIIVLILVVLPKFKIVQTKIDAMNRVARENLTGLRVVRAFNAEAYETQKFEKTNDELTRTQLFTQRAMSFLQPAMTLVMSGLSLGIYWVGAWLLNQAAMLDRLTLFSNIIVFSSYAIYVIFGFMMLVLIFMILPRAEVSAARINQVMSAPITLHPGNETGGKAVGEVEFRNVTFQYPDASEPVLRNISFTARQGETIAFIGSTGSGKTTLVELAARLLDVTDGEVRIDGVDIRDYTFRSLYQKVGYIPQKAVLFSDSVRDNLKFGESDSPTDDDSLKRAIDISQGSDFVFRKTGGLDGMISQGGANVSGGQKQRLSIARSIARRPEILIFDDSFSALDYKTELAVRSRIATDLRGTTCLIVAQRIGTIRHADRIIVLDGGETVGIGTHEELMKTCPVYQEIALSQLSAAELA